MGVDLADVQLKKKFNKGIRFLLCVIDICSTFEWVVSLKDKKGVTVVNAFLKFLGGSMELHLKKAKNIWVDKKE